MKNKIKKAHCAVDYAFQRIGGKYKGRILWVLREGFLRYGELNRALVCTFRMILTPSFRFHCDPTIPDHVDPLIT